MGLFTRTKKLPKVRPWAARMSLTAWRGRGGAMQQDHITPWRCGARPLAPVAHLTNTRTCTPPCVQGNVEEWSRKDVRKWLKFIGMDEYKDEFRPIVGKVRDQ